MIKRSSTGFGQFFLCRSTALRLRLVFVLSVVSFLSACSNAPSLPSFSNFSPFSKSDSKSPTQEVPADKIYASADALLSKGKYEDAAKQFEEVDRQYPYSPFARRSIVMGSYAHYKAEQYPEAIQAATRYTTLHPGTKEAPLAYHVIAMSHYDQITSAQRDQTQTRKALQAMQTLALRYPESPYAGGVENKIRITKDMLAANEMTVGRFYLKKHNYIAAINRFKVVVQGYQDTRHIEEALARLVEAYMALGVVDEAQTAAAVLGHNFPNSRWYKDSYTLLKSDGLAPRENNGSWISKAWDSTVSSLNKINPL